MKTDKAWATLHDLIRALNNKLKCSHCIKEEFEVVSWTALSYYAYKEALDTLSLHLSNAPRKKGRKIADPM